MELAVQHSLNIMSIAIVCCTSHAGVCADEDDNLSCAREVRVFYAIDGPTGSVAFEKSVTMGFFANGASGSTNSDGAHPATHVFSVPLSSLESGNGPCTFSVRASVQESPSSTEHSSTGSCWTNLELRCPEISLVDNHDTTDSQPECLFQEALSQIGQRSVHSNTNGQCQSRIHDQLKLLRNIKSLSMVPRTAEGERYDLLGDSIEPVESVTEENEELSTSEHRERSEDMDESKSVARLPQTELQATSTWLQSPLICISMFRVDELQHSANMEDTLASVFSLHNCFVEKLYVCPLRRALQVANTTNAALAAQLKAAVPTAAVADAGHGSAEDRPAEKEVCEEELEEHALLDVPMPTVCDEDEWAPPADHDVDVQEQVDDDISSRLSNQDVVAPMSAEEVDEGGEEEDFVPRKPVTHGTVRPSHRYSSPPNTLEADIRKMMDARGVDSRPAQDVHSGPQDLVPSSSTDEGEGKAAASSRSVSPRGPCNASSPLVNEFSSEMDVAELSSSANNDASMNEVNRIAASDEEIAVAEASCLKSNFPLSARSSVSTSRGLHAPASGSSTQMLASHPSLHLHQIPQGGKRESHGQSHQSATLRQSTHTPRRSQANGNEMSPLVHVRSTLAGYSYTETYHMPDPGALEKISRFHKLENSVAKLNVRKVNAASAEDRMGIEPRGPSQDTRQSVSSRQCDPQDDNLASATPAASVANTSMAAPPARPGSGSHLNGRTAMSTLSLSRRSHDGVPANGKSAKAPRTPRTPRTPRAEPGVVQDAPRASRSPRRRTIAALQTPRRQRHVSPATGDRCASTKLATGAPRRQPPSLKKKGPEEPQYHGRMIVMGYRTPRNTEKEAV